MGWMKLFANGQTVSEPASWSKTDLEGMIGVSLVHESCLINIQGWLSNDYWQSDDYIANFSNGKSEATMIKRRIELLASTPLIAYISNPSKQMLSLSSVQDHAHKDGILVIDGEDVGRWIILEVDLLTKNTYIYTHASKI